MYECKTLGQKLRYDIENMHQHYHTFIYSSLCHNLNRGPKSIRDKLGLIIRQFYGPENQTTSNFRINSKDL